MIQLSYKKQLSYPRTNNLWSYYPNNISSIIGNWEQGAGFLIRRICARTSRVAAPYCRTRRRQQYLVQPRPVDGAGQITRLHTPSHDSFVATIATTVPATLTGKRQTTPTTLRGRTSCCFLFYYFLLLSLGEDSSGTTSEGSLPATASPASVNDRCFSICNNIK